MKEATNTHTDTNQYIHYIIHQQHNDGVQEWKFIRNDGKQQIFSDKNTQPTLRLWTTLNSNTTRGKDSLNEKRK